MNATSAANSDGSDPSSRHASMMGSGGAAASRRYRVLSANAVPKVSVNGRREDVIFFDGVLLEPSRRST